ncbi:hypothetical protein K505DRAFT_388422, partial [Melanomma pulvis-pyrius CBS 109.77]
MKGKRPPSRGRHPDQPPAKEPRLDIDDDDNRNYNNKALQKDTPRAKRETTLAHIPPSTPASVHTTAVASVSAPVARRSSARTPVDSSSGFSGIAITQDCPRNQAPIPNPPRTISTLVLRPTSGSVQPLASPAQALAPPAFRVPQTPAAPRQRLPKERRECNHTCRDKQACKYKDCCVFGVVYKPDGPPKGKKAAEVAKQYHKLGMEPSSDATKRFEPSYIPRCPCGRGYYGGRVYYGGLRYPVQFTFQQAPAILPAPKIQQTPAIQQARANQQASAFQQARAIQQERAIQPAPVPQLPVDPILREPISTLLSIVRSQNTRAALATTMTSIGMHIKQLVQPTSPLDPRPRKPLDIEEVMGRVQRDIETYTTKVMKDIIKTWTETGAAQLHVDRLVGQGNQQRDEKCAHDVKSLNAGWQSLEHDWRVREKEMMTNLEHTELTSVNLREEFDVMAAGLRQGEQMYTEMKDRYDRILGDFEEAKEWLNVLSDCDTENDVAHAKAILQDIRGPVHWIDRNGPKGLKVE